MFMHSCQGGLSTTLAEIEWFLCTEFHWQGFAKQLGSTHNAEQHLHISWAAAFTICMHVSSYLVGLPTVVKVT